MDQQESSPAQLEDQLRSMILSNGSLPQNGLNPGRRASTQSARNHFSYSVAPPMGASSQEPQHHHRPFHSRGHPQHRGGPRRGGPPFPPQQFHQLHPHPQYQQCQPQTAFQSSQDDFPSLGEARGARPSRRQQVAARAEMQQTMPPPQSPNDFPSRGRGAHYMQSHNGHNATAQGHMPPVQGNVQHPPYRGSRGGRQQLFNPSQTSQPYLAQLAFAQSMYLEKLASAIITGVDMSASERDEKEAFRRRLDYICNKASEETAIALHANVLLESYGSFRSGFATKDSDLDLAFIMEYIPEDGHVPVDAPFLNVEPKVQRLLEKSLLDHGIGAHLLSKTRVPIIKVCEQPSPELYAALKEERQKWDNLSEEEKWAPQKTAPAKGAENPNVDGAEGILDDQEAVVAPIDAEGGRGTGKSRQTPKPVDNSIRRAAPAQATDRAQQPAAGETAGPKARTPRTEKFWYREKALGPLDFPKDGVGIQCDINFSNQLALHNTQLLRCYSRCDPRVKSMVLFTKAWAKRRKVNSSRNGTLSSYGYVLMVLHYLVNIAEPPVLPNLQLIGTADGQAASVVDLVVNTYVIEGYEVTFWRDEEAIARASREGRLTSNRQQLGELLRGFFNYYAVQGYNSPSHGFQWTRDVISLRTWHGILPKEVKGWTGARTTTAGDNEVRHRYLFAIEDPFELDHNVARTVTHQGIVAIRDEFRRAWRILMAVGKRMPPEGGLFDEVVEPPRPVEEQASAVPAEPNPDPTEQKAQDSTAATEEPEGPNYYVGTATFSFE